MLIINLSIILTTATSFMTNAQISVFDQSNFDITMDLKKTAEVQTLTTYTVASSKQYISKTPPKNAFRIEAIPL